MEEGVRRLPAYMYLPPTARFNHQGFSNNPHHNNQNAEAPARSRLYYIHTESLTGKFFSFPWIVAPSVEVPVMGTALHRMQQFIPRAVVTPGTEGGCQQHLQSTTTAGRPQVPPEGRPPIAVLLANMNWNAYNSWGGRSNYIHPVDRPYLPGVNSRFDLDRYTIVKEDSHFFCISVSSPSLDSGRLTANRGCFQENGRVHALQLKPLRPALFRPPRATQPRPEGHTGHSCGNERQVLVCC